VEKDEYRRRFDTSDAIILPMVQKGKVEETVLESIPQLAIQLVNTWLLGQLQPMPPLTFFSISLSVLSISNTIWYYAYWNLFRCMPIRDVPSTLALYNYKLSGVTDGVLSFAKPWRDVAKLDLSAIDTMEMESVTVGGMVLNDGSASREQPAQISPISTNGMWHAPAVELARASDAGVSSVSVGVTPGAVDNNAEISRLLRETQLEIAKLREENIGLRLELQRLASIAPDPVGARAEAAVQSTQAGLQLADRPLRHNNAASVLNTSASSVSNAIMPIKAVHALAPEPRGKSGVKAWMAAVRRPIEAVSASLKMENSSIHVEQPQIFRANADTGVTAAQTSMRPPPRSRSGSRIRGSDAAGETSAADRPPRQNMLIAGAAAMQQASAARSSERSPATSVLATAASSSIPQPPPRSRSQSRIRAADAASVEAKPALHENPREAALDAPDDSSTRRFDSAMAAIAAAGAAARSSRSKKHASKKAQDSDEPPPISVAQYDEC